MFSLAHTTTNQSGNDIQKPSYQSVGDVHNTCEVVVSQACGDHSRAAVMLCETRKPYLNGSGTLAWGGQTANVFLQNIFDQTK
jgi:hypothetical protein